jgi:hypothetical protein
MELGSTRTMGFSERKGILAALGASLGAVVVMKTVEWQRWLFSSLAVFPVVTIASRSAGPWRKLSRGKQWKIHAAGARPRNHKSEQQVERLVERMLGASAWRQT